MPVFPFWRLRVAETTTERLPTGRAQPFPSRLARSGRGRRYGNETEREGGYEKKKKKGCGAPIDAASGSQDYRRTLVCCIKKFHVLCIESSPLAVKHT